MKKLLLLLLIAIGVTFNSCTKDTPTTSVVNTCPSTYTYWYYYINIYGLPAYYSYTYYVYNDGVGCYILYYNYGVLTKLYI